MLNIKIIERELYSNCEALNSLSKHHLKYWLSSGVKKRVEGWVYIAKIKELDFMNAIPHFNKFKVDLVTELYNKNKTKK